MFVQEYGTHPLDDMWMKVGANVGNLLDERGSPQAACR